MEGNRGEVGLYSEHGVYGSEYLFPAWDHIGKEEKKWEGMEMRMRKIQWKSADKTFTDLDFPNCSKYCGRQCGKF